MRAEGGCDGEVEGRGGGGESGGVVVGGVGGEGLERQVRPYELEDLARRGDFAKGGAEVVGVGVGGPVFGFPFWCWL